MKDNKVIKEKYEQLSIFDYIDEKENLEGGIIMKDNIKIEKKKKDEVKGIDTMKDMLICNICGKKFKKICENDEGNNPDPIVRNWGCCDKCNTDFVILARVYRSEYFKNETDEICELYKKADKLFTEGKFVQAIKVYAKLTKKSNKNYWPYWDMYLTAREIAKIDNEWNCEVENFFLNTVKFAPKVLQDIFKTVYDTYKKTLVEVKIDE